MTIDLDAFRATNAALGTCAAEQANPRIIEDGGVPWFCSLPAGHAGNHEVHVDYVYTDGRAAERNVVAHSWA